MTEQLKASDQMVQIGRMNNIRASATEIVDKEIIYA
ncbi:MAG: TnpV protein [Oscillospiraceae bacterium]|nr:TnpV protein [Oscillospiraceae bacterium]